MKIPMRPIGAGLRKPVYQKYSFGQRRTFLSEPQRRKATTASGPSLRFPLIDHHYEYFANYLDVLGKRKANKHSAIVVGAGGAGLRAAVGLAESGLDTACISKLVCFSQLLNPHIIFTDWHPL
jgi:succinate dehydrogenase (ubiquinone) flavoprotein subunit